MRQEKKQHLWIIGILLSVLLFFGFLGYGVLAFFKAIPLEKIQKIQEVGALLHSQSKEDVHALSELLPVVLGFDSPKTYLVLFLNNTEIRPGGGFIGSFALVRAEKGSFDIIAVEGTENLDAGAPKEWQVAPPEPLARKVGVRKWFFRDSNWSPDFSESSKRSLEFYAAEGGEMAEEVDAVVGITTTALERVLALLGPVEAGGISFSADSVVEILEHEVEYGYAERGVPVEDRKDMLHDLGAVILPKLEAAILESPVQYLETALALVHEKHVLAYSPDIGIEQLFAAIGADGRVASPSGDFLLWVDANLAALKTDHAMERDLQYSFHKGESGRLRATATMTYRHTGVFDWRTTRYLSYTRLFVPEGSTYVSLGGTLVEKRRVGVIATGSELGKSWFGTDIRVEPGETETLSFTYDLPLSLSQIIEEGAYTLLVQKQLGTEAHGLTLDLDFGTTVATATPEERETEWYDGRYKVETDLEVDREFRVSF